MRRAVVVADRTGKSQQAEGCWKKKEEEEEEAEVRGEAAGGVMWLADWGV